MKNFMSSEMHSSPKSVLPSMRNCRVLGFKSESHKLKIGICQAQGHRSYQEDRWSILNYSSENASNNSKKTWSQYLHLTRSSSSTSKTICAVFDGHGNASCSSYCSKNLHKIIQTSSNLQQLILNLDSNFCDYIKKCTDQYGGSTANIIQISPNKITCVNSGDSRSVYYPKIGSKTGKNIIMSSDHSPLTRPDEVERITNLGGNIHTGLYGFSGILTKFLSTVQDVTISLRVYHSNGIGGLNMTRALGDVYLKPLVIPDAEEREVDRGEGYVVMGSDGLWDVVGVGEVGECLEEVREGGVTLTEEGGGGDDRRSFVAMLF